MIPREWPTTRDIQLDGLIDQSLSTSMTSGECALLEGRPPPSVCPPPPHEAPGAEEAADSGRELTVEGVGAIERGARPDSVFPLPPNDGGWCCENTKWFGSVSQARMRRKE